MSGETIQFLFRFLYAINYLLTKHSIIDYCQLVNDLFAQLSIPLF